MYQVPSQIIHRNSQPVGLPYVSQIVEPLDDSLIGFVTLFFQTFLGLLPHFAENPAPLVKFGLSSLGEVDLNQIVPESATRSLKTLNSPGELGITTPFIPSAQGDSSGMSGPTAPKAISA